MSIASEIFRAYDIRGVVDDTLTIDTVNQIGKAFGTTVKNSAAECTKVVIGRDGRLSGPKLEEALIEGLQSSGCDVISIGQVPTPVLYYASKKMDIPSAIMITGSHNPPNYNGLKMVLNDQAIYGNKIKDLQHIIDTQKFTEGHGTVDRHNISQQYIHEVVEKIVPLKKFKIVIDAGNGVAGDIAPTLFEKSGHEVKSLYCDVDGNFPNHHPDPGDPKNLVDLIKEVTEGNYDLGLAFDGDGDRLGIVDNKGKIIFADRILMAFAIDVLTRHPNGTIIYDIKSTQNLSEVITKHGGSPLMWKTGHSLIKAKMKETNAILAGEMSGHIFIADNWYGFDDALFAGALLLKILSQTDMSASEYFATFPEDYSTPEIPISVTEQSKFQIMTDLKAIADFPDAVEIITLDGLRVNFKNCWGLIRPSNTSPKLIARFEGKTSESLQHVQRLFKNMILKVQPDIDLPF